MQDNMIQTLQFMGDIEEHDVRFLVKEGAPWFVLNDLLLPLDLTNVTRALERLDDDDLSSTQVVGSDGRTRDMKTINESGLYSLILGSRKPAARAFKRWVTSEVLPSIRRTGSYHAPRAQVRPVSDEVSRRLERQTRVLKHGCEAGWISNAEAALAYRTELVAAGCLIELNYALIEGLKERRQAELFPGFVSGAAH